MKTTLIWMWLSMICFLNVSAQQDVENKIKATDKWADKLWKSRDVVGIKVLNNEEFMDHLTDGGGQLRGHYIRDSLLYIYEFIGLSYGYLVTEYFIKNERLILVMEKEYMYPLKGGSGEVDKEKPKHVYSGRFYFENDKIYHSKKEGKRTFDDELLFDSQTKEGMLVDSFYAYRDLLKLNR